VTIRIELVDRSEAEAASTAIRRAVFQEEQGIPAALDFDGRALTGAAAGF
jgi:hypothetical protein